MQCPSCRTENSPKVKFCAECGTAIGIPCPHCAFRNARDAAVCGGCGRSLSADQPPLAERRQITVLFADIAGSTALAECLDPEDLRDLYARYQALCAEILRQYEGHLAQYLGDGVLAYFGYPAAHEDDAARAVRAGLSVLEGLGRIHSGPKRPQVRVGIHTGLVVVGDVGAGQRHEQLALGEAPNIAARLQSEAVPGTIVISDATRRLLAGQFSLEDLGSATLKGLSRPMQLFRVVGASGAASRFHAMKTAQGLTPFVGRGREVEAIRAAWNGAAAGNGRTLLLRGAAGMGKSRLLDCTRQLAAGQLHEVFDSQCSPYQTNTPLYPIIEMLERRMGIEKDMPAPRKLDLIEQFAAGRGVALEEAASAVAALLSVPTLGRYPEQQMSSRKGLRWMLERLTELLLHAVGGSPLLLLLEDLHWADPSTLDLLGELVTQQTSLPVLLVCTTRPEFSAPWLRRPNCAEIRVESLPPDDARTLVARITGRKPLPLAVREEIVTRAGGVPLFLEALTRTVMEAGILRELDDHYELAGPLPPGLIPATVQDSLMARIDRLGEDRPLAQLAATIGRESSFELLQAVLDKPAEALDAPLRRLVDCEIVSQTGAPPHATYIFRHALIQDAAYESLLRKSRQEFHRKIAQVLLDRFPAMAEEKPELLARHYEGAGRTAEAIAGWMTAGRLAEKRQAVRECAAYLQKAIGLLATLAGDDPDRLRLEMEAQVGLCRALVATLGWASRELEAAARRAADLGSRLGDTKGRLGALLNLSGTYLVRGDVAQGLAIATKLLDEALATRDPVWEISARHTIGFMTYHQADFIRTREHCARGFSLYTPERERAVAAFQHVPSSFACGIRLACSLFFLGYPEQAEQAQREAWAAVETLNITACTIFALGCMLDLHYLRRDVPALAQAAEQTYALAAEEGSLYWAVVGRISLGWVRAMNGAPAEGVTAIDEALESYRMTGTGFNMPTYLLKLAEAHWLAGNTGEALASVTSGLAQVAQHHEYRYEPELHRLRAEILARQGAAAAAETSLHCAIEIARARHTKTLELRAALPLARLYQVDGRAAEAHDLIRPLHDWFKEGRDLPELVEARALLDSLAFAAHRR